MTAPAAPLVPQHGIQPLTVAEAVQGAVLLLPSTPHGGDERSAMLGKEATLAGSGALLFHKVLLGWRLAQESC